MSRIRSLRRRWPAILGLLALGSPVAAAFLSGAAGDGALRDDPVTLRLLAVRVEFQTDTLRTTTGDGSFESAFRFDRSWAIDPLPHDSLYFADQLSFLDHYYGRVSSGRLRIESEVWPRGATAAYRLEQPMWHYNWNRSRERGDQQLALLFQDAWQAADADEELEFFDAAGQPRFDAFVVFHAGVGQDFGEDSTPHDIPSAYLLAADLVGPELDRQGGVAVADGGRTRPDGSVYAGGSGEISAGLVLPEGENHEDFQHGMAGVLVLQFGHVIGLPNLYDGVTGGSVIGKWGLMDQGSANFRGLLPALPSAWIRVLKGWDDALPVEETTEGLQVARLGLDSDLPRILKVPLTGSEYLLVENRERDADQRGFTWGRDREGRWARLNENYSIVFEDTLGVPGDSAGVLVEVGDLDFDLPGSGLLVWHVDESRTTPERIAGNSVNSDPLRRGVDLEEADGIQDIGEDYAFFSPRSAVALGGADDAFRDENVSWGLVNDHLSWNDPEYSWRSTPSSDSNDGWITGVRLHGFGPPGDSVSVSVSFDLRPGFHGAAISPPLDAAAADSATVQLFAFEGGTVLSLLAGGEARALALDDGAPALRERGDGYRSLLPDDWSTGLDGLWTLPHPEGLRLLAKRGSVLATFRRVGEPAWFTLEMERDFGQAIDAVAVLADPLEADFDWSDSGGAALWAVVGRMLFELDPVDLSDIRNLGNVAPGPVQLVALRDGSGEPGLLVSGPFPRLRLGGLLDTDPPANALELLALDAHSGGVDIPVSWGPAGTFVAPAATALLRDPDGVTLYFGSEAIGRIDCPNLAARPLQAGDGPALEIALLTPEGDLRLYNQAGVEIARAARVIPVEQAADFSWLTGSRGDGLSAHWFAALGRATAIGVDGTPSAGWPRALPETVDGLHGLPGGDWLAAVRPDGRVEAWEADLDGLVWGASRGDANGGGRAVSVGIGASDPLPEVVANEAFVWPNPAADVAHFRFRLDGPARVTLSVFDVAGEQRHSQSREFHPTGAADGEIVWETAGVAPGGYFCVLEAAPLAGGKGWTRRVKCAVLR